MFFLEYISKNSLFSFQFIVIILILIEVSVLLYYFASFLLFY